MLVVVGGNKDAKEVLASLQLVFPHPTHNTVYQVKKKPSKYIFKLPRKCCSLSALVAVQTSLLQIESSSNQAAVVELYEAH